MPKLSMTVSHCLGADEAVRRLKARYHAMKDRHAADLKDLEEHWNGNTLQCRFRALGMHVAGTVTADAQAVRIDAELPLAAMMFKGMIEKRVRDELGLILA